MALLLSLPLVRKPEPPPPAEFRGLWVTRFDWTNYGQPADPARIDEIVNNAATAGFNAIFFQVRGTADAYYTPGPEPWAQRVSGGALGQRRTPAGTGLGGDPLAYFIQQAHARDIELHAYINVYPVWNCGSVPPAVTPEHFYYKLQREHGIDRRQKQWPAVGHGLAMSIATPTSGPHPLPSLATCTISKSAAIWPIITTSTALHLDHIRYGAAHASCDPVSAQASGVPCFQTPSGSSSYAAWQRAQVNGTVRKFYDQIIKDHPDLLLSAAVWPIYINYWGWPGGPLQGYHDHYQDSKAWIQGSYIDSISPMIYGGSLLDAAGMAKTGRPISRLAATAASSFPASEPTMTPFLRSRPGSKWPER